ncbi:MAG: glucosamine-6-phosphate deaminase [Lachnospiraceae bacterium]|nr:glucosamine-6-phosphate deaminase [Lachnospiraceae bacterium]
MRIYVTKDYAEMSRKAANIISAQIILKPDSILGLATGSTPVGTYDQLVEWYKKGDLDFSELITVNLDEYKGLGPDNPQSYVYYMHKNLFDRVNIKPENTHLPDGLNDDPIAACGEYNELLQSLGEQDLQLLGLGRNGHIGFNEPDDIFDQDVHCVSLTNSTIEANKRFFEAGEEVPKYAYTMGIRSILRAKKILVAASGEDKADAVYKAFFGPVTPLVPASILQLHDDVILVADKAAYSKCGDGRSC